MPNLMLLSQNAQLFSYAAPLSYYLYLYMAIWKILLHVSNENDLYMATHQILLSTIVWIGYPANFLICASSFLKGCNKTKFLIKCNLEKKVCNLVWLLWCTPTQLQWMEKPHSDHHNFTEQPSVSPICSKVYKQFDTSKEYD